MSKPVHLITRINYAALTMKWPATLARRGESKDVINMVMTKYRDAGWFIALVVDDRDGDFIQIEAP